MKKLAIYDLKFCPITYDFVHFIACARLYFAEKSGNTSFDLIIIAGELRQMSPRDKAFNDEQKRWRIMNLLVPIIGCTPCITTFQILQSYPTEYEKADLVYPPTYNPQEIHGPDWYFGSMIHKFYTGKLHPACFEAHPLALSHAKSLFPSKYGKRALISPRFSEYESCRNTKMDVIIPLIHKMQSLGFTIGFIHDQEDHGYSNQLLDGIDDIIFLPEASFNLPLRIALSEISEINLVTPSAIFALMQLIKSHPNIVCFDMHKPQNDSYTGDYRDYKMRGGMMPGKNYTYPWSTKNNFIIWEKNNNIEKIASIAEKISCYKRPSKYI